MFLVSLKSLKGKLILLVCVVIAAVSLCIIFASEKEDVRNEPVTGYVSAKIDFSASTEDERKKFISSLGYISEESPDSIADVVIPEEFDDVYTEYNELQKISGLDLNRYKGKTVKKYSYVIVNYPDYENTDYIRLTMLVFNGKIIGGDICSTELDGFMVPLTEK